MPKTVLSISIDMEIAYMLYEKRDRDGIIISEYIEDLVRRDLGLPVKRRRNLNLQAEE
ncbi:MAG: hypothetical protein QXI27_02670 [Nitrososphaerota archaeon]